MRPAADGDGGQLAHAQRIELQQHGMLLPPGHQRAVAAARQRTRIAGQHADRRDALVVRLSIQTRVAMPSKAKRTAGRDRPALRRSQHPRMIAPAASALRPARATSSRRTTIAGWSPSPVRAGVDPSARRASRCATPASRCRIRPARAALVRLPAHLIVFRLAHRALQAHHLSATVVPITRQCRVCGESDNRSSADRAGSRRPSARSAPWSSLRPARLPRPCSPFAALTPPWPATVFGPAAVARSRTLLLASPAASSVPFAAFASMAPCPAAAL